MKKIFIGGFEATGKGLISKIIATTNYDMVEESIQIKTYNFHEGYDFNDINFVKVFNKYYFDKNVYNTAKLRRLLKQYLAGKPQFCVKQGLFMFLYDKLKQWIPNSTIIHVVRDPIDYTIHMNTDLLVIYKLIGGRAYYNKLRKAYAYEQIDKKLQKKADYIIKLDDLILKPKQTIENLMQFIEIKDYDINKLIELTKGPTTVGSAPRELRLKYQQYKLLKANNK